MDGVDRVTWDEALMGQWSWVVEGRKGFHGEEWRGRGEVCWLRVFSAQGECQTTSRDVCEVGCETVRDGGDCDIGCGFKQPEIRFVSGKDAEGLVSGWESLLFRSFTVSSAASLFGETDGIGLAWIRGACYGYQLGRRGT